MADKYLLLVIGAWTLLVLGVILLALSIKRYIHTQFARARPWCGTHYSFFSGTPKWPPEKSHLTYGFLPGVHVSIDDETLRSVIASAFSKWEQVSHFTFEETESVDSADLKIGFFNKVHGNCRQFKDEILAHAFAPTVGWLHFNANTNWGIGSSSANDADLESIALHEIGHLLGLDHSCDPNAVMYPYYYHQTRKENLVASDIEGIRALYDLEAGFRSK